MPLKEGARKQLEMVVPSIRSIATGLLQSQGESSDLAVKWFKENIKGACRQVGHFLLPHVSRAAYERGLKMGIGDIRQYEWNDQRGAMKDPKRSIFHQEHVVPLAMLRDKILNAVRGGISDQDLHQLIIDNSMMAWILKSEDARLQQSGYNHKRPPDDPIRAYDECGIELVDDPREDR